ncbi:hypothetical protein Tco_0404242 [Tanacetum coccineum]
MAAVEVPQTLEYRGGQLKADPVLEVENFTNLRKRFMCHIIDYQMNSIIKCLTANSTWDDVILYHEGPSDVKESRVIDLKLCYNTFKFKEGESLTQTFTIYKALMNELVNDGIKLSKHEINTGFINGLPKKRLAFCQSLRNTNHVKESQLASLFDSPDDEEDTRSSQEYMNDIEEEYQARALLAKSKRFFKNGTLSSAKAIDQTEWHKCGRKGHFARDCFSKTSVPSYHKSKGLIAETYEWDEEEVSSDENKAIEVKALMALANEERVYVSKESVSNGEWVKISIQKVHTLLDMEDNDDRKSFLDYLCIDLNYHVNTEILKENQNLRNELKELTSITETWLHSSNKVNQYNSEVSITGSNKPNLSEVEDSTLSTHDTGKISLNESQRNTIDHSVVVSDSSATGYDSADESSTIKSNLKSNPTFKAETLKGITLKAPSLALAKDNKKGSSALKTSSTPAGKLKNVTVEDDPLLAIVMKELNELKLQLSKEKSSHFKNHQPQQVPCNILYFQVIYDAI